MHLGLRIWAQLRRRAARRRDRGIEADPPLTVEQVLRNIGLDVEAPTNSNNPGQGRRVPDESDEPPDRG